MQLRNLMSVALMAALMAVLSFLPRIPVPLIPVPITLQSLGVMLAGIILGARLGAASQLLFLLLVAAGAPLLGGRGGITHVLFGPSAGYLLAWPVGAYVIGWLTERAKQVGPVTLTWFNVLGGIVVVHIGGIIGISVNTGVPLLKAALGDLIFIPGDVVKAVAAALLGLAVRRALSAAGLAHRQSA